MMISNLSVFFLFFFFFFLLLTFIIEIPELNANSADPGQIYLGCTVCSCSFYCGTLCINYGLIIL